MRSTFAPATLFRLIAGDALALLIVTWIGFGTHGESIASPRWLTTFLPLCIGWGLAAGMNVKAPGAPVGPLP